MLRKEKYITRSMVRDNPDTLFVFGDNMMRRGMGGQAAAMRGEPNALGIPTKWSPSRHARSYFCDGDWDSFSHAREAIVNGLQRVEDDLRAGQDVVIPAAGIGTGLAELPLRAPVIYAYISSVLARLERTYGEKGGTHDAPRRDGVLP